MLTTRSKPGTVVPVVDEVDAVLLERGMKYENAFPTWLEHGNIVSALESKYPGWMHSLLMSRYAANWMHCLGKLLRAANEPNNPDHWLDLEGYARLVRKHIEERHGVSSK